MNSTDTTGPPPSSSHGAAWVRERRLQFIEFRLQWDGRLNRSDLVDFFSISVPQASLDIARYMELCPANMVYDRSSKAYIAGDTFKAQFATSGAKQYLAQLRALAQEALEPQSTFFGYTPSPVTVPTAQRAVDVAVLKALVRAVAERAKLRVTYQSITSNDPPNRDISPHAFVHDGRRWHVRAYCHLTNDFRDFVIGRLVSVQRASESPIDPGSDADWRTEVELVLVPHPHLSAAQRLAVEADFSMKKGEARLQCRKAMLYYTLRRLDFERDGTPREYPKQVCLQNLAEIRPMLKKQPSLATS